MRTIAIALLLIAADPAGATPPPAPDKKSGEATLPESASEGPRETAKLAPPLRAFVLGQPYGKEWKEIVASEPAPKDKTGMAEAETHPDLKNDPIEMQAQVQFLADTNTEVRYGLVSIRGVRVYRFGRLSAVQLVFDRIGRDPAQKEKFESDLSALAELWKNPISVLELDKTYRVKRNDLADVAAKKSDVRPPLRIAIEPRPVQGG
jgi:hypothetical protein